jgi:competence protein ComEC
VLANLLAMPVVSAWVMPMGLIGVIAMPFGFDAEFWRQMGYGIDWIDAVALWVAGLLGAFDRVNSFGTGPLLVATAGLLAIGLLKTPLRWSGAVLAVLASFCVCHPRVACCRFRRTRRPRSRAKPRH